MQMRSLKSMKFYYKLSNPILMINTINNQIGNLSLDNGLDKFY